MSTAKALTTGLSKLNRMLGQERVGFLPGEMIALTGLPNNYHDRNIGDWR